jgi:hypothetical protein
MTHHRLLELSGGTQAALLRRRQHISPLGRDYLLVGVEGCAGAVLLTNEPIEMKKEMRSRKRWRRTVSDRGLLASTVSGLGASGWGDSSVT